jgi:hypothetical protein
VHRAVSAPETTCAIRRAPSGLPQTCLSCPKPIDFHADLGKTALGPRVSYGHHRAATHIHLHVDVGETGVFGSGTERWKRLAYGEERHQGIGTRFVWLRGRWHTATLQPEDDLALVLPVQGVVGDQRGTGHRVCHRPMDIRADTHSGSGIGPQ